MKEPMLPTERYKEIKPQEGFQTLFATSNVDVIFGGGAAGGGKQQPLDSHVLTPDGWVEMGQIKVGSEVMTPYDGVAKVTQIFPQGVHDVYELRTKDGRFCECGLEHLWSVRTRKQLEKFRKGGCWGWITTLTTEDIIKGMQGGKEYYLPNPSAIEYSEKALPIHPYVLGALIGDGCLTNWNGERGFKISNTERDIIEKIQELSGATRVYEQSNCHTKTFYIPNYKEYKEYLSSVGLLDYSYNKGIPTEYLFASIEQRKQLLYGLFDTDGHVGKRNRYTYSTTSARLKKDFIALCRSLGYTCTYKVDKRNKYTKGSAYSISIHTDDVIFTSKKHGMRYDNEWNMNRAFGKYNDHNKIVSIKKVRKAECQCILVDDSKHLYITDDYTVTHNSYALVLAMAEPLLNDGDFRALISRRSLQNQKAGGGFVEKFKEIFGEYCSIKESDSPRVSFDSGAFCDLTYIDDSNMLKLRERAKGWEYDLIAVDELTEMSWEGFSYMMTRNRGKSKTFTGKMFATMNPKRSHWVRQFIDWYVGRDGNIIPERDGVVRYFYVSGSTVKDVVWGNSKEEVYRKCKIDIDRKLSRIGKGISYESMIKSFVFYEGLISGNKALIGTNEGYLGSLAAAGGKMAQALLEGNWNVDPEEEDNKPIPSDAARKVFTEDPAVNGEKWVTVDLADFGKNNLVAFAWNGFHIVDKLVLMHSTPRENAINVKIFAQENDTPENHIIYDGTSGRYFGDYVPDAICYLSGSKPLGLYSLQAPTMKDLCYLRLVRMIKRGQLTMDDKIADSNYTVQGLKYTVTFQDEFMEECSVVKFKELPNGKKKLLTKKEMNAALGKDRSMDVLDPCAMRMMPCLEYEYGTELEHGFEDCAYEQEQERSNGVHSVNIYDNNIWS